MRTVNESRTTTNFSQNYCIDEECVDGGHETRQQTSTMNCTKTTTNGNGGRSSFIASKCLPSSSSSTVYVAQSTTAPLSQGKKYIDVQLLTRERLYLIVEAKCKISDVFNCVCAHVGFNYSTLFGLTYYVENEYRFCDADEKLSKYAQTKNWHKAPGSGTDSSGNPTVIFYLRVHTYVDFVRLISCPVALLHYYLQLRENVRIQWEPSWVPEERCFESAAYALQADYGDYRSDRHCTGYFRADAYFPMWVINGRGLDYVLRHMPAIHRDFEGLEQYEARVRYCKEVSRPPCPVNMHLYGLRKRKCDTVDSIYLGITPRGLEVFEQKNSGDRQHLATFVWSKIGKLAFERKKFTMASLDGQKMVFYASSDEKSRYLLNFCRSVHQNIMHLQADIAEARRTEFEERKQFRESYIYSDNADLEWVKRNDSNRSSVDFYDSALPTSSMLSLNFSRLTATPVTNGNGAYSQRVSLVSEASSNTTSGIVSDRQHTHDDSENENDGDADFDGTTGCDSSPLVSELSLATTGTSAQCVSDCRNSQHGSPVSYADLVFQHRQQNAFTSNKSYDNRLVEKSPDESTEDASRIQSEQLIYSIANADNDKDEFDTTEGGLSIGPCSDKTVTAAADDTQSTGTTSTTGKLEELSVEGEFATTSSNEMRKISADDSAVALTSSTPEGDVQHSPFQPPVYSTTAAINYRGANISIAELRRQTLGIVENGKNSESGSPSFPRRISPPILPMPTAPIFAKSGIEDDTKIAANEAILWQGGRKAKLLKTLSTQTSSSLLSMAPENQSTVVDEPNPNNPPKAYRIVASQPSFEMQTADVASARSTPSPSSFFHLQPQQQQTQQTEVFLEEPPPPPPYSYSNSNSNSKLENQNAYSPAVSMSSIEFQNPPQQMSADNMANYEMYNAEWQRRAAAASVPTSSYDGDSSSLQPTARRWCTVSGVDQTVWAELSAMGAHRLQQAQSEPGLTSSHLAHDDRMTTGCANPMFSHAQFPNQPMLSGNVEHGYRSISTHQLPNGANGIPSGQCMGCQNGRPVYYGPTTNFHHRLQNQVPANNRYTKRPAAATVNHRLLDYPNHQPQFNSKAVSRVHSMYEAAKADQVRRSLEYDYYRQLEQEVVENTRRQLHLRLRQHQWRNGPEMPGGSSDEAAPSAATDNEKNHHEPGHFCESCQENHESSKIDLVQLKNIIRAQEVDLPLMRALCNDPTWQHQEPKEQPTRSTPSPPSNSTAHPLLRPKIYDKGALKKSSLNNKTVNGQPSLASTGQRPVSWHESFMQLEGTEFALQQQQRQAAYTFSNHPQIAYRPASTAYDMPIFDYGDPAPSAMPYAVPTSSRFASTPNLFSPAIDYQQQLSPPPPPPYSQCRRVGAAEQYQHFSGQNIRGAQLAVYEAIR